MLPVDVQLVKVKVFCHSTGSVNSKKFWDTSFDVFKDRIALETNILKVDWVSNDFFKNQNMDKQQVGKYLSSRLNKLEALNEQDSVQLEALKFVVGQNLIKRKDIFPESGSLSGELPSAPKELEQQYEKYADKVSDRSLWKHLPVPVKANKVPSVLLRENTLNLPFELGTPASEYRWNEKRSAEVGPFAQLDGTSLWFDLFETIEKVSVQVSGETLPLFLFSDVRKSRWIALHRENTAVNLVKGFVWIKATLLFASANQNDYVGLNIEEGSFSTSNTNSWTGTQLNVQGLFTGTLQLNLQQETNDESGYSGCSAANSLQISYPKAIQFNWKDGVLTDWDGSKGSLEGYGNRMNFKLIQAPIEYDAARNHVLLPADCSIDHWESSEVDTPQLQLKGEAPINHAYWALAVSRIADPSTLAEPKHNGGWLLQLGSGILGRWQGMPAEAPNTKFIKATALFYPSFFFFTSNDCQVTEHPDEVVSSRFFAWQLGEHTTGQLPLDFLHDNRMTLVYQCHAVDGETLLLSCQAKTELDKPVYANASSPMLPSMKGWRWLKSISDSMTLGAILQVTGDQPLFKRTQLLVLKNALLEVSHPGLFVLNGVLATPNDQVISKGQLTLVHQLHQWKPILPDPYVSNIQTGLKRSDKRGSSQQPVYSIVRWVNNGLPRVSCKALLPGGQGQPLETKSSPKIRGIDASPRESFNKDLLNKITGDKRWIERMQQANVLYEDIDKRLQGWKLLDVSTNKDLIGVVIGQYESFHVAKANGNSTSLPIQVDTLELRASLSKVHLFTTPLVQWEPVRTVPEINGDPSLWFPEYLSSATDGGATRLIGEKNVLAPVIPDIVLDSIQTQFKEGYQAMALTTLSFGLKSQVKLFSNPAPAQNRNADTLENIQPSFPDKQMKGGVQIQLKAEGGTARVNSRSPGFEGVMTQTLNGHDLFSGIPLGLSVLGSVADPLASVETQFNNEFSHGGTMPYVPVSRFDLSGYGASNFSEWENPGALASIGQVQFKILVGRTAFEIVKFVSKLYPWGNTVTRSVTIERKSNGGVIRKDSGWQATQSGILDFRLDPALPNPYQVKPGLFRGCFGVRKIRPVSADIVEIEDTSHGVTAELAPVYFDAWVKVEGQQDGPVFGEGLLGFIQLSPKPIANAAGDWVPRLLGVNAFKKLIEEQGPIGGPVQTLLNVGNSDLLFDATRVEIDVTEQGGIPYFIGMVRGQPRLPNNGSWSVVKLASPTNTSDPQEATSASHSGGTPLFINNQWAIPINGNMQVTALGNKYLLRDPEDVLALQPRYDYGFLQNTGTQSILYRRPEIQAGIREIQLPLSPAFADPFAMLTSKGAFPPIENAIEFPPSSYALILQAGNQQMRLNQNIDFTAPRPPLVVTQDGTDQIEIVYDQSRLQIQVDYNSYAIQLSRFDLWSSIMGIERFSGIEFNLSAGSNQKTRLINNLSKMKDEIQNALNFLPGMGSARSLPDIDLGMTNAKHEVKVHTGFECKIDFTNGSVKCRPDLNHPFNSTSGHTAGKTSSLWLKFSASAGVDSVMDTSIGLWEAFFGATLGAELQGRIPIGGPFFLVLGLRMNTAFRSPATLAAGGSVTTAKFKSFELTAYAGVGAGGNVGPFSASVFLAIGIVFVYENDTAKLGGMVRLEGEADLKIVTVNLYAELRGVVYKGTYDGMPNQNLIDATGSVGINVSILFVINIKASYSYTTTERL